MRHYKRRYTSGTVKAVARKGKRGTTYRWKGFIREGVIRDAIDEHGRLIMQENGTPKTVTDWRTLSKVFDVECAPDNRNTCGYKNITLANTALKDWHDDLERQAEADYKAAVAADEAKANSKEFSYGDMTVPAYLEMYLKERADIVEPSTLEGYGYLSKYVEDYFADFTMAEVNDDDLKAFNKHMLSVRGLSSSTRCKALKFFKSAWDAHRTHLSGYPFEGFADWSPIPRKEVVNPLDQESLTKVWDDIDSSPSTPFMTSVALAISTGMRQGEICGLRWGDCDPETGTIHVVNAIGRTKGGAVCYEKGPKDTRRKKGDGSDEAQRNDRIIPGTPEVRSILDNRREYIAREIKQRKGLSGPLTDDDLKQVTSDMFVVGNVDGRFMNPTVLGRTWRGYAQSLKGVTGERPKFHDLRKTFISYTRAATKDRHALAKIAGHSPEMMERVYAHVFEEDKANIQQVAQQAVRGLVNPS